MLLNLRLRQLGLKPVDVGDGGHCFFPSSFSSVEYINNMSMQSTWCDALLVQAVGDCKNVVIHIIESHENLAGETLIEPHYLGHHPSTTIYLGHLNELHY